MAVPRPPTCGGRSWLVVLFGVSSARPLTAMSSAAASACACKAGHGSSPRARWSAHSGSRPTFGGAADARSSAPPRHHDVWPARRPTMCRSRRHGPAVTIPASLPSRPSSQWARAAISASSPGARPRARARPKGLGIAASRGQAGHGHRLEQRRSSAVSEWPEPHLSALVDARKFGARVGIPPSSHGSGPRTSGAICARMNSVWLGLRRSAPA
jgi:hypothetical protein